MPNKFRFFQLAYILQPGLCWTSPNMSGFRNFLQRESAALIRNYIVSSLWLYCTLQYIYSQTVLGEIMATEKPATLTFRIEPNLKEALCIAADRDHRSIANMVAVMIREYCARVCIPIKDTQASAAPVAAKPKSHK